jgi:predicted lipoprotein with Yx(FWY)xxD motif
MSASVPSVRQVGRHRLVLGAFGPIALALVSTALLSASCSSNSTTAVTSVHAPTIAVRHSAYGQILTTGTGYTLYMFTLDTPSRSGCPHGACTALWPPLEVKGKPTLGKGVNPALVGEITRPSGAKQVTYAGHPLYRYSVDGAPGQATGQALEQFGGLWYVMSPSGKVIKTEPS